MKSTTIFINLPVDDLARARAFFSALGFAIDDDYSDAEHAVAVELGDNQVAMLLARDFFSEFTTKKIADTSATSEVILCLGVESRDEADELLKRAIAAGGTQTRAAEENEGMYGGAFADPDGHLWEVLYMEEGFDEE